MPTFSAHNRGSTISICNTECHKGYKLVRKRTRSFVTCGYEKTWTGILSGCKVGIWACYNSCTYTRIRIYKIIHVYMCIGMPVYSYTSVNVYQQMPIARYAKAVLPLMAPFTWGFPLTCSYWPVGRIPAFSIRH